MRSFTLVASSTTAVLMLACARCGETSIGPQDAAADQEASSIPTDARRDTAWWDGAQISDWPGWRRYTEIDPSCRVDIAIDPKLVVVPWKFVPCEIQGQPGCQQLDGIKFQTDGITPAITNATAWVGGRYLALAHRIEQYLIQNDYWDTVTGEPVFSIRTDLHSICDVGLVFSGKKVTAISTIFQDPLTTLTTAGPADVLPPTAAFAILLPRPETKTRVIETLGASDTTLLFDLQTVGLVGRGTPGKSDYVLTSVGTRLSAPQVHGDDIIAEEEHAPDYYTRFHRVNPDGTITLLREKAQTRVTAVAMDESNLAWVEAWGGSPSTPQLAPHIAVWSAPYTVDPTVLANTAKKAADWDGTTQYVPTLTTIVSNGIYAFSDINGVNLTRLVDGKTKVIASMPNLKYGDPVYVTNSELWVLAYEQQDPHRLLFERLSFGGF